jgi:ankyrin repeat protein
MILGKDFYGSELELERLSQLFDHRSQISMFGFSLLHISCFGMSNLSIEDIISQAISPAVDPNDAAGRTPMSWAAQRGDDAVVGKLLSIGADPTLADFAGKTPLHWSVHAADNQCLERLLSYKADVEAKDKDGRTALCLAVHRGADLSFTEILLQHGANAKIGDWDRMTPLLWASLRDRPSVMSRLLEAGANVGCRAWGAYGTAVCDRTQQLQRTTIALRARPTKSM